MDDMVPGLLKDMSEDFQSQYDSNEKIQSLNEKLNNGTATYAEANEYASEVGNITKNTYETYLTSENLPDGKCYYNIADRVTSTTLHNQYELVSDYTEQVQTSLNKSAGIGLKAQRADEDTDGYHSLANYMSSAENYDDIAKSTAQSAERFARSTVDNSVKKNTEFQGKAGLSPKIVRSGGSGCCEWCSGLSGTYDYPKVPKDVYARHNNCTCTVEYDPGSGKTQNVWTKEWTETDSETLQRRQTVGLDEGDKQAKIEYRKNIGKKNVNREDVTQIYKSNYNIGTVDKEEGYVDKGHSDEEAIAEWIQNIFGGNITLLAENNETVVPDFLWNNKYWDLKTPNSINRNTLEKRVKHGLVQISSNQGGLIIDLSKTNISSIDEAEEYVCSVIEKKAKSVVDVIIKKGEEYKVIRIKK